MKRFVSSSIAVFLFIVVTKIDAWRLLHATHPKQDYDDALFIDGSVPSNAAGRYLYDDDKSNILLPFSFFVHRNAREIGGR